MKPCQTRTEPSPRNTNWRGGSWSEWTRKDKRSRQPGQAEGSKQPDPAPARCHGRALAPRNHAHLALRAVPLRPSSTLQPAAAGVHTVAASQPGNPAAGWTGGRRPRTLRWSSRGFGNSAVRAVTAGFAIGQCAGSLRIECHSQGLFAPLLFFNFYLVNTEEWGVA